MSYFQAANKEPYRYFFLLGALYLIWGALVWLPQIWNPGDYPVLLHRYLMLNGFAASFIGGFLMTAVPKFSQTSGPDKFEIVMFFLVTIIGLFFAFEDLERLVSAASAVQGLCILAFLFRRIFKRKTNPPYSFVFIFVGLILWVISGISGAFIDSDAMRRLHYEGAIAAIILGVGSRLIPGILGHVEIVMAQRERYEKPVALLKTVPLEFFFFILCFVGSYFITKEGWSSGLRALIVTLIAGKYWLLWKTPKIKSALTWSIWMAAWLIVISFILKATLLEGSIHVGHAFFLNGIVLMSLLIGVRVVQSHGPNDKAYEESPVIYLITFLVFLASATRVTAYLLPDSYLTHLGYSALILVIAVCVWLGKFGRLCFVIKSIH
jgi:uncharacterized protein involved in response to NO